MYNLRPSENHPGRKHLFSIICFIFLTNLILRWLTLTDSGIWYDEAYSIFYSQQDLNAIKMVSTWDIAPPFYNYLLHFWMSQFGISEFAVRMMSVLFASLSAVLLFALAYRHFGMNTALLSSALFLVHNEVFYYAQEARTYALLAFLAIASAFCFFELLRKPKWYWMLLLGIINWAGVYSQYVFIIVPAIQAGVAIISIRGKVIVYYILSVTTTALLFGKWLYRIRDVIEQGGNSTIHVSTKLPDLLDMLYRLMNGRVLFYSLLLLSLVGLMFYLKTIRKNPDYSKLLKIIYLLIWAFGTVTAIFISKSSASTFIPRYLFFTVPAFCLSAGFLISQIPFSKLVVYLMALTLFVVGFLNININIQKGTDYKNAGAFIKENQTDSTLIIIQTNALGQLFSYYYDQEIFTTKDSFEIKLFRKHVVLRTDSTMKTEVVNCFSKVILAQTFQQFGDPGGTIISFLNKRFASSQTHNQFADVFVTEFEHPINRNKMSNKEREACFESAYQKDFVEPKKEMYRQRILNDSGWLNAIREKAQKNNVPLDTMIDRDAVFMIRKE